MKKLLLLLTLGLIITACSKNNDSPTDILKAKIIGEWESYGAYKIYKDSPDDITYSLGGVYWNITNSGLTAQADFDIYGWRNEPYIIQNDSLFVGEWSRHIRFAGDSCMLTSNWGGTANHVKSIMVLHPKGTKK